MRPSLLISAFAALAALPAAAQNNPPAQPNPRIAGTIATVDANGFTVRGDNGMNYSIALDARSRVVADSKLDVNGIKPGDHFASDLTKAGDGWRSIVGHTQNEAFGNNALWFRPVAGKPGTMRILGIVENVTPGHEGARVKVKYDSGELEFEVPSTALLYHVSFGGPSLLKPNLTVNAAYEEKPDGTLVGRFVTVEKDGQKPIAD
jgi:hypothetical protein